jgi:hypothetical protein
MEIIWKASNKKTQYNDEKAIDKVILEIGKHIKQPRNLNEKKPNKKDNTRLN